MKFKQYIFDYLAKRQSEREPRFPHLDQPLKVMLIYESDPLERNDAIKTIRQDLLKRQMDVTMWGYVVTNRAMGRRGFEAELLAFFSCTVSLAVVAGSQTGAIVKQTVAIVMGVILFFVLGLYLRDLNRTVRTRYFMAAAAVGLLSLSLVFGAVTNGAQNWISIGGISLQPSELAKVCFIFAGAATLERLYVKHNLWGFIILTFTCLGLLALMSDYGTAAIFFVVFLVTQRIGLLDATPGRRSAARCAVWIRTRTEERKERYMAETVGLISLGCVAALGLVLRMKPYIAARFATWGHAWQYASTSGYQQVRAMSAAASGGLVGVGLSVAEGSGVGSTTRPVC